MRRHWPGDGRRHVFAFAIMALALLVALAMKALTGSGTALTMAFFPALLAVTFYSGAVPAVIGWLFAICATAFAWSGSFENPILAVADRWALLAFAISTALSIAIGARARRAALEQQMKLLRVEEQAQHDVSLAEENKHMALSKLSHDLRTPLSTIVGWAQVLRAQNPPEQMLHGLEVIERNARTQTRIIQELLEARRAPAAGPGVMPTGRRPSDIPPSESGQTDPPAARTGRTS
ncbi:MAG TPA: histidine kinase dimerization/phospho-acceptor domain-containing protein [Steroidobacteraceae bacterium]